MSTLRRYTGKVASRILGLPPHETDFTVQHGLRVPMRDGVELIADHYAPVTARPAGTLLVRGPYGRRFPFSAVFAQVYAARGYHVVLQSVRGTFGSGGQFTPMVHEMADGPTPWPGCEISRGSPDRSPRWGCHISASPNGRCWPIRHRR